MSKPPLLAPVSPVLLAVRVYPVPTLSIDNVLKVATPATAFTVFVPLRVPDAGLLPIATVIEAVLLVTRLPPASCTCTVTAGVIDEPDCVLLGCWAKASLVAAPAVMLNAELVAPVRPVLAAVRVYPLPALSIARSLNVAIPPAAATVLVPLRVPELGFVPIATVIDAVLLVTRLTFASCICRVTAGVMIWAAAVLVGCCAKASLFAAPGVMLKGLLVAPVRPVLAAVSV